MLCTQGCKDHTRDCTWKSCCTKFMLRHELKTRCAFAMLKEVAAARVVFSLVSMSGLFWSICPRSAEEMWVRTMIRPCSSVFYLCVLCRCVLSLRTRTCVCVSVCLSMGAKRKAPYLFFFLWAWLKSSTSCASEGAITRLRYVFGLFYLTHDVLFKHQQGAHARGSWARCSIVAKASFISPLHILIEHGHMHATMVPSYLIVPSCVTFFFLREIL